MYEWVVGYQKAAQSAGPSVEEGTFEKFEQSSGLPVPDELRALYAAFDGGKLSGDVALYPWSTVESASKDPVAGLPAQAVRFGVKGGARHLFAAKRGTLSGELPDWTANVADDDYLFATFDGASGQQKVYRTLERLLAVLVPPTETESFGEMTFAKAMAAVESSLGAAEPASEENGRFVPQDSMATRKVQIRVPAKAKPASAKNKPSAKKPAKKAAAKARAKAPAKAPPKKRAPARKAAKKLAKKPVKKGASKKVAPKKKPAKKKSRR